MLIDMLRLVRNLPTESEAAAGGAAASHHPAPVLTVTCPLQCVVMTYNRIHLMCGCSYMYMQSEMVPKLDAAMPAEARDAASCLMRQQQSLRSAASVLRTGVAPTSLPVPPTLCSPAPCPLLHSPAATSLRSATADRDFARSLVSCTVSATFPRSLTPLPHCSVRFDGCGALSLPTLPSMLRTGPPTL